MVSVADAGALSVAVELAEADAPEALTVADTVQAANNRQEITTITANKITNNFFFIWNFPLQTNLYIYLSFYICCITRDTLRIKRRVSRETILFGYYAEAEVLAVVAAPEALTVADTVPQEANSKLDIATVTTNRITKNFFFIWIISFQTIKYLF